MEIRTLIIENSAKSVEVVINDRDFEDLLDKYLGFDCAKYYRDRISELEELNNDE